MQTILNLTFPKKENIAKVPALFREVCHSITIKELKMTHWKDLKEVLQKSGSAQIVGFSTGHSFLFTKRAQWKIQKMYFFSSIEKKMYNLYILRLYTL
jgi:hypothetical protein